MGGGEGNLRIFFLGGGGTHGSGSGGVLGSTASNEHDVSLDDFVVAVKEIEPKGGRGSTNCLTRKMEDGRLAALQSGRKAGRGGWHSHSHLLLVGENSIVGLQVVLLKKSFTVGDLDVELQFRYIK